MSPTIFTLTPNNNRKYAGFTLLEFVVVISLIAILGVIVLDRYWQWHTAAEHTAVKTVIGNLKSALGMQVSYRALKNETHLIPKLVRRNPMELLAQKPLNYIGEFSTPQTQQEVWYYNKSSRLLVYNFRNNDEGDDPQKLKHHRYRIKLIYNDHNKSNRFDNGDSVSGLDIVQLDTD